MNLQFYFEKLYDSEEFQKFKKENPDAYLCSGFVIIDKEKNEDKQHFDFYLPERKMVSFQIEKKSTMIPVEQIPENPPEKINDNIDFEFKEIEQMIIDKMEQEEIKNTLQKILLSIQSNKGKVFLLGTIFISGLGMIKCNIDLKEKKITEFQKNSFFDMLKIINNKD